MQLTELGPGQWSIFPEIDNKTRVVFSSRLSEDPWLMEIFLYDNGKLVQITDSPMESDNRSPEINELGWIAWRQHLPGQNIDIALFRNGQIEIITSPETRNSGPAFLPDGKIIYSRWSGDSQAELFLWDDGEVTQITDNGLANQGIRTNSQGKFVWTRYNFLDSSWRSDVMLFQGGEFLTLPHPPDAHDAPQGPDLNDFGIVVWREYIAGPDIDHVIQWSGGEAEAFDVGGLPRINNHGDIYALRPDRIDWQANVYRDGVWYQLTDEAQGGGQGSINDRREVVFPAGIGSYLPKDIHLLWEIRDPGDFDNDGDVDAWDFESFLNCVTGPEPVEFFPETCRNVFDLDEDEDVDFADFGLLQRLVGTDQIR